MATTIKLKNGSGAPLATDLVQGEVALDLTNKRIYSENASGTVIEMGTSPSTIDINAGTIDGTTIGGSTPAAGTFTTLTANGNVVLGDAATDTVTVTADVASDLIPSADGTYDLGASGSEWQDLFIDGTANIDSLVADTADINGGTIDGVTIGGASAGAGTFTTLTTGSLTTTGDINFGDNDKAIFGAGSDLQIYHSATKSYIRDAGTGDLVIGTDGAKIEIYDYANTNTLANLVTGGAVELFHNGDKKLATTSSGIDVTGTVVADGLTVENTSGASMRLSQSTSGANTYSQFEFYDSALSTVQGYIRCQREATTVQGSIYITTKDSVSTKNRVKIHNTGDISFYEDTGTTPKLFWDASAESLGIGTTSPTEKLDVSGRISITTSTSPNAQGQYGYNLLGGTYIWPKAGSNSDFILYRSDGNPGLQMTSGGHTLPGADNTQDLGSSTKRWNDLFLGGGVYLGGTGAANHLDDYEEGTFTPTLAGSTTAGSFTYSNQAGYYVKVGNKVTITFNVTLSAIGTAGTGFLRILGSPWTTSGSSAAVYARGSITLANVNFDSAANSLVLLPRSGSSAEFVINEVFDGASIQDVNVADLTATSNITGQITFLLIS